MGLAAQSFADEAPGSSAESQDIQGLIRGMDLSARQPSGEGYYVEMPGGLTAGLSLDRGLQEHLEGELERYAVPTGSVVAMVPSTGEVLAYVNHGAPIGDGPDVARDPTPPAASVFKVITAAALVDAGVGPDTRVCYGGGFSRLTERDLEDDERRDRRCGTLSDAMGSSINAIFAKLADRNLEPGTLERYASAFGFGHALPFDLRTRPSPSEVPEERLEFARTSAGFWHMHMSPMHGALIAATVANAGQMPRPGIVSTLTAEDGEVLYRREPSIFRSVIGRGTARSVGRMMERTVTHGTARRSFFDPEGNAFLPGIRVAGKTGTLSGSEPYRGYTWWVGFAPADAPEIAVAALVVNEPRWRIKASYMAREALRYYLVERPRRLRREQAEREQQASVSAVSEEARATGDP